MQEVHEEPEAEMNQNDGSSPELLNLLSVVQDPFSELPLKVEEEKNGILNDEVFGKYVNHYRCNVNIY